VSELRQTLENVAKEKVKTEKAEASSSNPKVQSAIEQAEEDQKVLRNMFNMRLENVSAGGIKRIIKSLVTFQEVNLKKDEFELHALTEHLLKAKLTILLTAASNHKEQVSEESTSEQKKENK
jgi:hypothetical protein